MFRFFLYNSIPTSCKRIVCVYKILTTAICGKLFTFPEINHILYEKHICCKRCNIKTNGEETEICSWHILIIRRHLPDITRYTLLPWSFNAYHDKMVNQTKSAHKSFKPRNLLIKKEKIFKEINSQHCGSADAWIVRFESHTIWSNRQRRSNIENRFFCWISIIFLSESTR